MSKRRNNEINDGKQSKGYAFVSYETKGLLFCFFPFGSLVKCPKGETARSTMENNQRAMHSCPMKRKVCFSVSFHLEAW